MPNYSGSALSVQWIYSGGTIALAGDSRSFNDNPTIDTIECTAGPDASKSYINGPKSGQMSIVVVDQQSGTTITNALVEGTSGTLIVGLEGTATGKQKKTIPAISLGAKSSAPYNDIVTVTCDFIQNGDRANGSF